MWLLCKTEMKREKGGGGFVTMGKANTGLLSLLCFLLTASHFNMSTALLLRRGGPPGQRFLQSGFPVEEQSVSTGLWWKSVSNGYSWRNQSEVSLALPTSLLHRRRWRNGICTTGGHLFRFWKKDSSCQQAGEQPDAAQLGLTHPACGVQIISPLPFPAGPHTDPHPRALLVDLYRAIRY